MIDAMFEALDATELFDCFVLSGFLRQRRQIRLAGKYHRGHAGLYFALDIRKCAGNLESDKDPLDEAC